MIRRFAADTALLVIDAQQGVHDLQHWGGPTGRRNNPGAESNIARLLAGWRARGLPVLYTAHDSREAASPLKLSLPTGRFIEGLDPRPGEPVTVKDVNGAFTGTSLEINLRRAGVTRLVLAGFFTNFCVETSARSAGNMGFDTYLAQDACSTCNRVGPDGRDHDPQLVHDLTVANLHREFCTAISTGDAVRLLDADADDRVREQGNEAGSNAR